MLGKTQGDHDPNIKNVKGLEGADGKSAATGASTNAKSNATGWGQMQSTTFFRTFNFELYAKPNKVVMGAGLAVMTGCVAYIAYWNATSENRKDMYTALDEEDKLVSRRRASRWD